MNSHRIIRALRYAALAAILCTGIALCAQTQTTRIVAAANTFLSTLNEKQRASVVFAFDDQQQRQCWSNFPTGFIPRAGISLREMTPAQRTAAMTLLLRSQPQRP